MINAENYDTGASVRRFDLVVYPERRTTHTPAPQSLCMLATRKLCGTRIPARQQQHRKIRPVRIYSRLGHITDTFFGQKLDAARYRFFGRSGIQTRRIALMSPDNPEIRDDAWHPLSRNVIRAFGDSDTLSSASDRRRELEKFLRSRIRKLLQDNPARLMSILYRIDVREHDVIDCLEQLHGEALVNRLSDLVIARQLEKLETRRRLGSNLT